MIKPTARELTEMFPRNEGEETAPYSRRLVQLAAEKGWQFDSESIRVQIHRWKRVSRKLDKHGNEVSSVERYSKPSPDVPEGFSPVKITTTHGDQHWITYQKDSENFEFTKEFIKEVVEGLDLEPIKVTPRQTEIGKILALTYTDVHIGMETDEEGTAMYPIPWTEKEIFDCIGRFVSKIGDFWDGHDAIHVRDLGDFLDGYNGLTTRGGHKLPQNMTTAEAYKVGARFKIKLAQELARFGVPLYFHNIVNDNHAGEFAELLNYHVQQVLAVQLPSAVYHIQRKFIEHYNYGVHSFIFTHGKDKKFCKAGMTPDLSVKNNSIIQGYINNHRLNEVVTFEKGDSHLFVHDKRKKYNYICHGALSPSSEWVQTNFNKGRQMFSIMEVFENEREINPLCFEV